MKLITAFDQLLQLQTPVFTTNDVSALLQISTSHASHVLQRLRQANKLLRLAKGYWGLPGQIDRLALPAYLCAPDPSYISLQTALHIHGIIEQIPEVIFAVSIGRTKKFTTDLASISIHHIHEDFFFGYEVKADPMVRIATPEKALIDFLYFLPNKTQLFHALPECDLSGIDQVKVRQIIEKIAYQKRRAMVERQFMKLL